LYRVEKIKWLKEKGLRRILLFSVPGKCELTGAKGALKAKEIREAEEEKEKTCTFSHARRKMRARRLGSGCDSEVWAVIRKQFTVAEFREVVNSQCYGACDRFKRRIGEESRRSAKRYYVEDAEESQAGTLGEISGPNSIFGMERR
jgi:hypothetical protein